MLDEGGSICLSDAYSMSKQVVSYVWDTACLVAFSIDGIAFHCTFFVFVVASNNNINFHAYNKVLVKSSVQFYDECWKRRCGGFHDTEV